MSWTAQQCRDEVESGTHTPAVGGSGDEYATTCDWCGAPTPWNVTCYAVPDGTWRGSEDDPDNGRPVVKIKCHQCSGSGL